MFSTMKNVLNKAKLNWWALEIGSRTSDFYKIFINDVGHHLYINELRRRTLY